MLEVIQLLEYSPAVTSLDNQIQLLTSYCNLVVRGYKGYYSSYTGQVYFERMGQNLAPDSIQHLNDLIIQACKLTGRKELDWLDLGCGSGRHLSHIYKHYPNVHVRGLELSQIGADLCKNLIRSEKLPVGSVEMGDLRQLPYASNSFDVVFSRFVLHSLPYLKNTQLGLESAFEEMNRVLRPGGVALLTMFYGQGRDYLLPRQRLNEQDIHDLARLCHFKVVDLRVENEMADTKLCKVKLGQAAETYTDLQVTLQKNA